MKLPPTSTGVHWFPKEERTRPLEAAITRLLPKDAPKPVRVFRNFAAKHPVTALRDLTGRVDSQIA